MYKIIKDFFHSQLETWIKSYIETYIDKKIQNQIESNVETYIKNYLNQSLAQGDFDQRIKEVNLMQHLVFGDPGRLQLSPTCIVNNALFNLSSGSITIGDYVFFGHNVSLLTGTHNYTKFGLERRDGYPQSGNDIVIEEGVWIASNVTVIAPCTIGKHSVVAAGAVVKDNIPNYHVVAGIPAKVVKEIKHLD